MKYTTMWYKTTLPKDLIDIVSRECLQHEDTLSSSTVNPGENQEINLDIRNSKNSWIDSAHWISGFCYHYILLANESNFKYDINSFGNKFLQYTSYSAGHFYDWHSDNSIHDEGTTRKLSFSLQLSDPEDYSGGELQFMGKGNTTYFAPKTRGTMIVFDSRVLHRVRKIKSGCRKSLVGWVEGPLWR